MRVTSDFFVSALIRRVFGLGGYAAVLHKGAAEAGAIHIRVRSRLGLESLFGPAPQSFSMDDRELGAATGDGRRFERRLSNVEPDVIDQALGRELRFDPDGWVVELECDSVEGLFPVAGDAPEPGPADSLFRR